LFRDGRGLKKNSNPRKTKKYQRLPTRWSEKYFDRVKNSKNAPSIALLSIAGCRPAELVRGAVIALLDDFSIQVCIESKKIMMVNMGRILESLLLSLSVLNMSF